MGHWLLQPIHGSVDPWTAYELATIAILIALAALLLTGSLFLSWLLTIATFLVLLFLAGLVTALVLAGLILARLLSLLALLLLLFAAAARLVALILIGHDSPR